MEPSSRQNSEFELPEGIELPEELKEPAPRPLPSSFEDGPLARRQRKASWNFMLAGIICLVMALAPFVKTLSLYVLPLAYLHWIGPGLFLYGIVTWFGTSELKKARRYIEEGEAGFGQVLELVLIPTVIQNGIPSHHAYLASVKTLHPVTQQVVILEAKSNNFKSAHKNLFQPKFHVGDYIPIVWMPDKFESTLQIYDFLEATPESCVQSEGASTTLLESAAVLAFSLSFFFILFWNIYASQRFEPLDFEYFKEGLVPMLAGGLSGLAIAFFAFFMSLKHRKQKAERNLELLAEGKPIEEMVDRSVLGSLLFWLMMGAGGFLMCGLTVECWCFTANALLDKSKPKKIPVEVTEMIETTHVLMFREYKLKYRRADDKLDKSLLTTPQHLWQFEAPVGMALVREGWFGWPWVETVEPVPLEKFLGDREEPEL